MIRYSICLGIALSLALLSCTNPTPSTPAKPAAPATRELPKEEPESFVAERAKFKDSAQYLGKKTALSDTQVQPGARALIVMLNTDAAKSDLLTIGSIHVQDLPSGLRVLAQVIAENESERLIIVQPLEDVLTGKFKVNYAIRDDAPWEKGILLGKGGQGVAYKWRDFAVKSAADEDKKWKRYLKLGSVDGIIKIRGFSETSGALSSTFFELLETRDLSSASPDEYSRVVLSLFKTLSSIHDLGEKHGDITPKNMMFRRETPVFIDLGTGGTTPDYSSGVSDEVALALSLISQRHANLFRQNVLAMISKVLKVSEPVAEKIRSNDPEFEKVLKEKGATIESYLVYRFLKAADIAFQTGFGPESNSVKALEEWKNKKFAAYEERGTRGLDLLVDQYLRYRDMNCDEFKGVLEKVGLHQKDSLGLFGEYPTPKNGHCDIRLLDRYKIGVAMEQVQISLAGIPFDWDSYLDVFKPSIKRELDKRIYADLKKMSQTDAMLVDLIQK